MRLLFVCLGNICRSPLAEGVMRNVVAGDDRLRGSIEVDSAGTGAWHAGEAPDRRSVAVAAAHGVSLQGQRARKVCDEDFVEFDRIVAMDAQNHADLLARCPSGEQHRVVRLRDYDPDGPGDVPDPYYGGDDGFDQVYAMVERCCRALGEEIASASA